MQTIRLHRSVLCASHSVSAWRTTTPSSHYHARCGLPQGPPSRYVVTFAKGFGETNSTSKTDQEEAAPAATEDSAEALEARIRGTRKGKKIEPKVKVNAPVAEAINSNREATPAERAETAAVLGLGWFFLLVLVEGLMLAGSGFLPDDIDLWIQDNVYPGYSFTVLLFLGCSSMYGLFKTGKLPGQKQL